jgi:biotin carboxylase
VPEFFRAAIDCDEAALAREVQYPCVLKPLVLSASRGVIRANNEQEFTAAFDRVRRLLRRPEVARLKDPALEYIQVERFIAGREFALEGLLTRGHLQVLALFDKPDPLDGPLFEESIYTTPSRVSEVEQQRIASAVAGAIRAIGLEHGPVHAEARANQDAVYVLEVAARPSGGLCTRALRFTRGASNVELISLEELLLRHSVVEVTTMWQREARASGVMMIPIERSGILAGVEGEEQARAGAGVETVEITAKLDQELEALPESATYLGFIFARAKTAEEVEAALREAYSKLRFRFSEKLPLASGR